MNIRDCLFFDIEATGTKREDIIDLLYPLERKTADDAPKNYKKEESINNWIDREWEKTLQEREEFVKAGALDIDTAEIVSIAWAVGSGEIICAHSDDLGGEKEVIRSFINSWNKFKSSNRDGNSVGYNSINYDWAVLRRRMSMLGLNAWVFIQPNMNRYYGEIDLMNVAYNFGYSVGKTKGLKTLAAILGIDPLVEDVDGSDVSILSKEELIEYNKSDVYLTREIFKKFNGVYLW